MLLGIAFRLLSTVLTVALRLARDENRYILRLSGFSFGRESNRFQVLDLRTRLGIEYKKHIQNLLRW